MEKAIRHYGKCDFSLWECLFFIMVKAIFIMEKAVFHYGEVYFSLWNRLFEPAWFVVASAQGPTLDAPLCRLIVLET